MTTLRFLPGFVISKDYARPIISYKGITWKNEVATYCIKCTMFHMHNIFERDVDKWRIGEIILRFSHCKEWFTEKSYVVKLVGTERDDVFNKLRKIKPLDGHMNYEIMSKVQKSSLDRKRELIKSIFKELPEFSGYMLRLPKE